MNDIWPGSASRCESRTPGNGLARVEFLLARERRWNELVGILQEQNTLLAALVRNAYGANRGGRPESLPPKHRNARERQGPGLDSPRSE
jgi:hypothetical protein